MLLQPIKYRAGQLDLSLTGSQNENGRYCQCTFLFSLIE